MATCTITSVSAVASRKRPSSPATFTHDNYSHWHSQSSLFFVKSTCRQSNKGFRNRSWRRQSHNQQASLSENLQSIYSKCNFWNWRGFRINYTFHPADDAPATANVLLVHGFGASVGHWRKNVRVLSERRNVYAIDLLGFGASDKPSDFKYSMENWAKLVLEFIRDVIKEPTVLVGNSVGSLACLIAAAESRAEAQAKGSMVQALVLLNCAGGMNNKALVGDWRTRVLSPLLWLIDFLLKQKVIASFIFQWVKARENLKKILESVYSNKAAVDDELIEVIKKPADDPGALDVFVSVVTGDPGPNPMSVMSSIGEVSILVLWGDEDPFTPLDGPVGKYFTSVSSELSNINFYVLNAVGHCPHDDRPELVHEKLLPWLDTLPTASFVTN